MVAKCAQCKASPPDVGVLCRPCVEGLGACAGLLPEHIVARVGGEAMGWLVDSFGQGHALDSKTIVGRALERDLVLLHGSVSREHAELVNDKQSWRLRDLGSMNSTQVNGERVDGRAKLVDRDVVTFGDASFYFLASGDALPRPEIVTVATMEAIEARAFSCAVRSDESDIELCLVAAHHSAGAGAGDVLYRTRGGNEWNELKLSPLEFQLVNVLCRRWLEESSSPAPTRGAVLTKQLAQILPFQSKYANEENVRQIVRRVRTALKRVGVEELVKSIPRRGYFVAWTVSREPFPATDS
jgi:hypothetical protein